MIRWFFFAINGMAGIEDWLDRDLLFEVDKYTESEKFLSLETSLEDYSCLSRLHPGKTYMVQTETPGEKNLKYYRLESFSIAPKGVKEDKHLFSLTLYISPLFI